MTTNVPFPTFTDTGLSVPSESDLFTGAIADIDTAFGGGLNQDPTTPQGQLATSDAAVIAFVFDLFLKFMNATDPKYSSGRMQDGIGRLYYQTRIAAQPTTVDALCTGAVGTVIQAGALAKTSGGDIYACTTTTTIPASGSVTIEFQNTVTGAVACPAGYLDAIYQAVPGWDTITNQLDGTIGRAVETPTQYEVRRGQSVSSNAVAMVDAIRGRLLAVTGVIDAYVIDNYQKTPETISGVEVAANSLYVGVYGGTDADVAAAIWGKKNPGCGFSGTTTVTVEDTNGGYVEPLPSYQVSFTRARDFPFVVQVTLLNNNGVPSTVVSDVVTAVQAVFAGTDVTGLGRPKIAGKLLASRFAPAIVALGTWAQIVTIKIGSANSPDAAAWTGSIAAGTNVLNVTAVASGALATGQTVGGALAGTTITGQTSGTAGGVGSYTVSTQQTLPAGSYASYAPTQDYSTVNMDELPGISAGDIQVVLE